VGLWEVGGVVCAVNIVSRLEIWLVWAALGDYMLVLTVFG
jgi:hypothetical protein